MQLHSVKFRLKERGIELGDSDEALCGQAVNKQRPYANLTHFESLFYKKKLSSAKKFGWHFIYGVPQGTVLEPIVFIVAAGSTVIIKAGNTFVLWNE